MFKQKRGFLLLVAFTMFLNIFFISFNSVIATDTGEEGTEITKALEWIKSQQDDDGFWDEENYDVYGEAYQLYTTKVIETIGKYNYLPESYERGIEALKTISPTNNDYLSRYLSIGDLRQHYDVQELIDFQNSDGGWGILTQYSSNTIDTMLAVKALTNSQQYNSEAINKGIHYLINRQNKDGSWSYTERSNPNIALTAEITLILSKFIENTGLTSEHIEISIRKSGEYLLSSRRADNTWGTDKENINGTLLALKAVSLSMRQPIDENIYENIKELQMENGSWYNDTYTTALALALFKEKDKEIENGINEKIKDIKAYKYEDNEKIETYSFNPYETAIFEIEGEFEKDDTDITLLLKKPSGTIITASSEEGYSWNIENSVDGSYTLIANLKDISTGKLIETFEKDIIIEKQFKISNIISKLYPKEITTNSNGISVISTNLINESNTNGEAQIKFTVIDSNQKIILNKTLNQYCEKENQIINIQDIEFNPNTEEPQIYKVKTEVIIEGQSMVETEEEFKILSLMSTDRTDVSQKVTKENIHPKQDSVDVLFKITGEGTEQSVERKPKDVVFILDGSKSIEEESWIRSKYLSKLLVNNLQEGDKAAIVRYGTTSQVEQTLTSDKSLLETKIDTLKPNLGTNNLDDGIKKAIEQISNSESQNQREKMFIIISDGHINSTVKTINEAYLANKAGIRIYNIGLGNEVNKNFLKNLAIISEGEYIDNPTSEQIKQLTLERSDNATNVSGKEVSLSTTIPNSDIEVDLTSLQPEASEIIENEDGSKTVSWNFDKITIGEEIGIRMGYSGKNLSPSSEIILTRDTKLTYMNKDNNRYIINIEDLKIPVNEYIINTSITTDKKEYEPDESVELTIQAKGYTEASSNITGKIDILDSKDNIVNNFEDVEIIWDTSQDKTDKYTLNLGEISIGNHKIRITWFEGDNKLFETKQDITIIPAKEKYFNIPNIILNINPKEVMESSDINPKIDISLINDSNIDGEVQIDISVLGSNGASILEETLNQYCKKEEQIIKIPEITFKPNTENPTIYTVKVIVSTKGQKIAETQKQFEVIQLSPSLKIDVIQELNKDALYPRIDDVEATIKLIGEKVSEATQRKPIDLVIAIDDSGSMEWGNESSVTESPNRLDFAKEAAKHIVDLLQSEDRAAIVEFAGHAWIQQDITHDKELLKKAIDQTPPSPWNGTGMGVGLRQSIDIFDKNSSDERQKIIILICDGDENIWSHSSVIAQANQALQKDIKVHGVGLGTDVSHNLLMSVSSITQGVYVYSPTMEQLNEIMIEVAGEIFNIAGKEIKLTTTIAVNEMDVDISKLKPQASEIIENEDGSKTIVWDIDKIVMGEEKEIKIEYKGNKLVDDTEVILTRNTKLTYINTNNERESIDIENLRIPVSTNKIDTKLNTDKELYKANENIEITVETKNLTKQEQKLKGKLEIRDKEGNTVKVISEDIEETWKAKETKNLNYTWNTEKVISDDYYVNITWTEAENKVSEAKKMFKIITDENTSNQVTTDKKEYNSNETVKITDKINNPSINSIESGLKIKNIITNNLDEELWTNETKLKELLPSDSTSITSDWNTERNLPGEYTVISKIYKGEDLISEDSVKFTILDSKEAATGISGKMDSIPRKIYPSDTINLTYRITNTGNTNLENIEQRIRIIDTETEEVIETITDLISLEIGEIKTTDKTWKHKPLNTGNYLVVYDAVLENGVEKPLDNQGFEVEKSKVNKEILNGSIFLNKTDRDNNLQIPLISQMDGKGVSIYTGMAKYGDRVPIEINDGDTSQLFQSINDRGSSNIEVLNNQTKRAETGGTYKLEIKEPSTGKVSKNNQIKREYLTRIDRNSNDIEFNYGLTKEDIIDYFSVGAEIDRIFMLPINSESEYEDYINGNRLFPSVSKPIDIAITDSTSLETSPVKSRQEIDLREHEAISTNKKLDIAEKGELTIKTAENTVMYLDKGIEISGDLIIEAEGRLDIYVSEQMQIDGNIFVNKGAVEVNIYVLGREDFQANNGAKLIGLNLYAPDSEVQLGNHVVFEGGIVCKHLQFNDTATFRAPK